MSRIATTIPPAYFDELYAANPDPWRFADSVYEREKYRATLDALPRDRYGAALEVGCSIGVLTKQLAARCDALLSIDVAVTALSQAESHCAGCVNVRFEQMCVPGDWPTGTFDLILLSEVVYYLDKSDVTRLGERVSNAVVHKGEVLLVHWLGETHYPLSGDEAVDAFIQATASSLDVVGHARTDDYRLDLLRAERNPGS